MKLSITKKLFLLFVSLMLVFIICGLLINSFFLEEYYIYSNRGLFEIEYTKVSANLDLDSDSFLSFIEDIDRNEGIAVTVTDKMLLVKYASNEGKRQQNAEKLPKEVEALITSRSNELNRGMIYAVTESSNSQTARLVYIKKERNDTIVILSKPLKGIRESAEISNHFYMLEGFFILIIGSGAMLLFSKRVTKPIIQMSNVAVGISNLNFDEKVGTKSKDEIGTLGLSINAISDKLKISIDGLKRDIEHQKELARNTSHELKTPIGVIKGYTEGLLFDIVQDKETRKEYLQTIISECDRMDKMVNELLDLSVLQTKSLEPEQITRFSVADLLGSVLERFEPFLKERQITCHTQIQKDVYLEGNYELLERAIGNIIFNAIKFNDDNNYIKITGEVNENKKVIKIFNTGAPIPEHDLETIFEVFYKVDKARSRKAPGHGLGLAIVKSIIDLHGGKVFACNKKGGVEFTIILN